MKSQNFIFETEDPSRVLGEITDFIQQKPYKSVLIQLYSGVIDKSIIEYSLNTIYHEINPICQANTEQDLVLIGATTAGEIYGGVVLQHKMILNVSCFENTYINAALQVNHKTNPDSDLDDSKRNLGKDLAQLVVQPDSKACILLMDGLTINGEEVAQNFSLYSNQIAEKPPVISGGMAGDNLKFQQTFVFFGNQVKSRAAVAMSLNSPSLRAFNTYNLSWRPLGPTLTITKSHGGIVHEINDRPIIDFYRHYLGQNIVDHMPESAIEFPLIIQGQEIPIARSMIQQLDNGSILFAGNLPEGAKVRFGVADQYGLEQGSHNMRSKLLEQGAEAIFAFSCSVRKAFYEEELQNELIPLDSVASLSGFFTYGEIYHYSQGQNCTSTLLNITTTILGLSEDAKKNLSPVINRSSLIQSDRKNLSYHALINLASTSYQELQDAQKKQQNQSNCAIFERLFLKNTHSLIINQNGEILSISDLLQNALPTSENNYLGQSIDQILHPDSSLYPITEWTQELPKFAANKVEIPITLCKKTRLHLPQIAHIYTLKSNDNSSTNYLIIFSMPT